MRISHSELEACRTNPAEWAANKLRPRRFIRAGYNHVTRLAIYKYHQANDSTAAVLHLRSLLDRFNLSNIARGEDCERDLESYIDWAESGTLIVAARKVRVSLDIGTGWTLGGEISRVDLLPETGGYRGILLHANTLGWQEQLRMPLLQRALGGTFRRNEAEFQIGVQSLDGRELETNIFSKVEIDRAETAARELARVLEHEYRRIRGQTS